MMGKYLALLMLIFLPLCSTASEETNISQDVAVYVEYYKSKGYSEVYSNELAITAALYKQLQAYDIAETELDVISIYADNIEAMPDKVWGKVAGPRKAAILTVLISVGSDFYTLQSFITALNNKEYTIASKKLLETNWCSNYPEACPLIARIISTGIL